MPDDLELDALLDHQADIERCVVRDTTALALAQQRLATSQRELDEVRAHLLRIDP